MPWQTFTWLHEQLTEIFNITHLFSCLIHCNKHFTLTEFRFWYWIFNSLPAITFLKETFVWFSNFQAWLSCYSSSSLSQAAAIWLFKSLLCGCIHSCFCQFPLPCSNLKSLNTLSVTRWVLLIGISLQIFIYMHFLDIIPLYKHSWKPALYA